MCPLPFHAKRAARDVVAAGLAGVDVLVADREATGFAAVNFKIADFSRSGVDAPGFEPRLQPLAIGLSAVEVC